MKRDSLYKRARGAAALSARSVESADRCPACGERAAVDSACAACGYRPQRALWKRERTDAFDELIDEGKRRVSFALILIAFVTVFAVWALSARGVSGASLALYGITVCAMATVFALGLAWRDARSFALLSMQWSYSDPVMGVFARGPGPTIEGPPLARYERRLSLTEVHSLDDSVTRAIESALSGERREELCRAIERLFAAGAVRVFIERTQSRIEPVIPSFPVRGRCDGATVLLARGARNPGELSPMERALLEAIEPSTTECAEHDDREVRGYRSLASGPTPALTSLHRAAQHALIR